MPAVQSVINYIERNRAGLARLVVVEALKESGYPASVIESPEAGEIRRSIEIGLLVSMGRKGLQEPRLPETTQEPPRPSDVAGSPPQTQEKASEEEPVKEPEREPEEEPATEPQPERQEMPGEEILEQRTPPPVPRRRR